MVPFKVCNHPIEVTGAVGYFHAMKLAHMPRLRSSSRRQDVFHGRGLSFLLSQVGAHTSRSWMQRLKSVGLDARRVMVMWNIARAEGRSQRELADALHLPASRVVALVDELEKVGLLERRMIAGDRRARALYLTRKGRALVSKIIAVAVENDDLVGQGLALEERRTLIELLTKVATKQGLIAGVHPDF